MQCDMGSARGVFHLDHSTDLHKSSTFTKPCFDRAYAVLARLEQSAAFAWGFMSPESGVINVDNWVARFTFFYQVGVT